MTSIIATELKAIASADLCVATRDEPEFADVIALRAFSARGVTAEEAKWPVAVLTAQSVAAVQQAIEFCSSHGLRVCIRSGGHALHSGAWLHGDNTILLDVGDLNSIEVDEQAGTVSVGPGAKGDEVLKALPKDRFFPCGHCPGVPVGGFVLAGGMGIGFTKYGMTSTLVQAVDVVHGTGEAITASVDSDDPREQAVCHLLRGSYTGFPGVITRYHFKKLPPRPLGVLIGKIIFDLRKDWKNALKLAFDMQFRGDDDAIAIETIVAFTHAPPPIAEATGVAMVAIVSLLVWGDTEHEGRSLWNKYTMEVKDTLVPIDEPQLLSAEVVPDMFGVYPAKARYNTQSHTGSELVYSMTDEEIATVVEPVVDMFLSEDNVPPPPSRTIFIPVHPSFKQQVHGGKEMMVTGYTSSLVVMSCVCYQDASLDSHYKVQLKAAHQRMIDSPAFGTDVPQGNVPMLGAESCYTTAAFAEVRQKISFLDPSGVFAGFPQQAN